MVIHNKLNKSSPICYHSQISLINRVNTKEKSDTPSDTDPEIKALRQKLQSMQDDYYNHVEHIFYTSRTHMQLTQVIKELKENSYLMKRHDDLGIIWILLQSS